MKFTKMQGAGNDYVYFDCLDRDPDEAKLPALAVKLSDRHFGIGGDGIVLICRSEKADAYMRMFNADGSEGLMCGNAVRCVARYLSDRRGIKKDVYLIETRSGVKEIVPEGRGRFRVDMGEASDVVPHADVDGHDATLVSTGNPHCVLFDACDVETVGKRFQTLPEFPDGVNVEAVTVLSRGRIKVDVFERGSGITLACGTGASASAYASALRGLTDGSVTAVLPGGELEISVRGKRIFMTGPTEFVFDGDLPDEFIF